ncbi:penicillin-binding protein 2 [Virgibacillus sp. YIM 98842]|uniref:peptidoglycan D,D-transpeptidase FtsI family protein n=1 Tax=Virgibacillus sp. YIM 98842 TaxID=2663533 RepID=UPI0013DB7F3E|nr:penicillin-binding protein 2 [Virgibacillus sp. YIM 98842]
MVKRNKKKRAQLPFRINIVFFVVFLLFSVLIMQLGVVQILQGQDHQDEIERTIQDTTKIPVPRGKIYDSNHEVIVDNKPLYSITYTPAKGTQAEDRLDVAEDLAELISMDSEDDLKGITERDKREYWYIKDEENKDKADERLEQLDDEKLEELGVEDINELSNAEAYSQTLELITEEEYEDVTEQDLEIIAIKKELDKAYSLTPQIIKNEDVTPEEYARVAENLDRLPGVNATTDWDREYPYGNTFKSLLGSITTQEQGIPKDAEQHYLSRGYSRNDRVGRSGLEEHYEDLLRGRKEQIQYTTTKNGTVVGTETVVEGERGKDLVLTIDMEFQEEVDKIVREELETLIREDPYQHRYANDALAVVIDPRTGELLAVSGQTYDREDEEISNAEFKTLYDAHRPGSIVKGATMLAGYESRVISPGSSFYDRPIEIAGTPSKGSWTQLGTVNDYTALSRSSNVYMFYIALKMGGENRYPFPNGSKASFNPAAFQEMRNYFQQFGLGASTGIDFPFESTGYEGPDVGPGLLMDFAIGQYDTFTAMQMAQYVATIANDGYRIRPHFLKEVRNPIASDEELGSVYRSVNTEVLNRIQMDQSYIERVQEGFRRVFHEPRGTGYNHGWNEKDYNPAGKTGTAEDEEFEDGRKIDLENLSLVGYAPYDEPEVAFAVIVPKTGKVSNRHPVTHEMGKRILDTYFEIKEERDEEAQEENSDQD